MNLHPSKGFQPGNKVKPRAPHTILSSQARAYVVDQISARVQPMLDAKFALALGHKVIRQTDEGDEEIYMKSPDANSLRYLFDQLIGRPRETLEITESRDIVIDF